MEIIQALYSEETKIGTQHSNGEWPLVAKMI
jgi:hypothetical protein